MYSDPFSLSTYLYIAIAPLFTLILSLLCLSFAFTAALLMKNHLALFGLFIFC